MTFTGGDDLALEKAGFKRTTAPEEDSLFELCYISFCLTYGSSNVKCLLTFASKVNNCGYVLYIIKLSVLKARICCFFYFLMVNMTICIIDYHKAHSVVADILYTQLWQNIDLPIGLSLHFVDCANKVYSNQNQVEDKPVTPYKYFYTSKLSISPVVSYFAG